MLTKVVSHLAVQCLESGGYVSAGMLMALESMIMPLPSEAVMPFVGFMVADGQWSLWLAVLATTLGSLLGSWLSYLMGFYGGRPLVLKVGRYLLLDVHDLERTERFFHGRNAYLALFLSRFIPVVRHLISIPAGVGRMPLTPFLILTGLGATLWNGFLLTCGMILREHWARVEEYSSQVDMAVAGLLALGLAWFVRSRLRRRRAASGRDQA